MVGIYPIPSRIVFYIDLLEFVFLDKFEIGTKYGIPNSKTERKQFRYYPDRFLLFRFLFGISRFWPNRNSNLDSPQSSQARQGALCSGFEYAPGCNYIDHRLPHSICLSEVGLNGEGRLAPGGWHLQLAACELAAASLPC